MEEVKKVHSGNMRDSGIELLKVIAILLIVISHVVQTLSSENPLIGYSDYILDLSCATKEMQLVILMIMRHFGALGNSIFFICSAWFLLDRKTVSVKKITEIMMDVWAISVLILAAVQIFMGRISVPLIVKSLLPTTFSNNWYLTCYILFYAVHTSLNKIIWGMTQKQLLKAASVLAFLYIGCDFVKENLFFPSFLILWGAIYFVIAYIKFYCKETFRSNKLNLILLTIGFLGMVAMVFLTNALGLKTPIFYDKTLKWAVSCNPFLILMALSAFGLAKNFHFKNKLINHISKLSLLIYVIHENILVRTYIRPLIWQWLYKQVGYDHVVELALAYAVVWFILALILSEAYKKTLQRVVQKLGAVVTTVVKDLYELYEHCMLKIS